MSEMMRVESRRVGTIEVTEDDVLHFEPIPGFPNKTRFVVVEHADAADFAWLVCLDDPDLAFVVTSPWTFFPNYDPPVDRDHLAALEIEKKEQVELLSIVSLMGKQIFLNLSAPLLINASTRRGVQVVSDDPRYTTQAAIPALKSEPQSAAEGQSAGDTTDAGATAQSKSPPPAP
ncbi:MAG: flagellar assembly protein FliW [Myxococcota bacterium]